MKTNHRPRSRQRGIVAAFHLLAWAPALCVAAPSSAWAADADSTFTRPALAEAPRPEPSAFTRPALANGPRPEPPTPTSPSSLSEHDSSALPSTGLPSTGLPSIGLPSTGLPSSGLPSTGLPSSALPSSDATRVFAAADRPLPPTSAGDFVPSALCILCKDYWQLLKGDVRQVLTSPGRWDETTWRRVGTKALLVIGAMALLDDGTNGYMDDHRSSTTDRMAADFEPFGRQYAAYVIGGYLLAGKLAHRPRAKAVAVDGLTSTVIAAGLIVPALKEITGRSRPRAGQGAYDFHPFNGGYSFPSGHTAAAFSVATSIAEHYDALWIKGLAYGVASLVEYARMEEDAHFLSDVTAGALIGIGVAHSVHDLDEDRRARIGVRPAGASTGTKLGGVELSVAFALR
jgi:membrane-associated phospholipid phosphatase